MRWKNATGGGSPGLKQPPHGGDGQGRGAAGWRAASYGSRGRSSIQRPAHPMESIAMERLDNEVTSTGLSKHMKACYTEETKF